MEYLLCTRCIIYIFPLNPNNSLIKCELFTLFPQGWEAQRGWVTYKTEDLGFKPRYICLWSPCSSHATDLLAGKQWYILFLSMRDSCGSVNSLIGPCFCQKVNKDRNNNLSDQLNYERGISVLSSKNIYIFTFRA